VNKLAKAQLAATFWSNLSTGTLIASVASPYIGFGMGFLAPTASVINIASLSGFGLTIGVIFNLLSHRALAKGL